MSSLEGLRGRGEGRGFTLLVLNRPKIASFFLPGGMAYRWANSIVREIVFSAKGSLYPGHGYLTGEMYRGIDSSVTPATFGQLFANVRSTAEHTLMYHEGTQPHVIRPRNGEFLRFQRPPHSGNFVKARSVNHPGFGGHPFLTEAMDAVLARRGVV